MSARNSRNISQGIALSEDVPPVSVTKLDGNMAGRRKLDIETTPRVDATAPGKGMSESKANGYDKKSDSPSRKRVSYVADINSSNNNIITNDSRNSNRSVRSEPKDSLQLIEKKITLLESPNKYYDTDEDFDVSPAKQFNEEEFLKHLDRGSIPHSIKK